ncbi:GntR family transcriptional regulator [Goodfellowiella coeruleoviolacea]|uniref:GntR family transcriptional regulator n=1 Tax=Goodfellowiella coeruleoviolacea TaxID=334858 RepID=A0AAE3KEG1_9PSEU|nr:GntR family transcriptional regulator [Goodfellowiella coeruleoviolacea]MCP2163867.1 GntR family transcriptional regulator [Goodfellowiella coeruleoviolacea]
MSADRIDRQSPLPFYAQLKQLLIARLEHEWAAGTRLPGEVALCERYGVSRTVVRQALDELEAEGRIVRRKGQGTFAAVRKVDESLFQSLTGLYEDVTARGGTLRSVVRQQELVPAPAEVAAELDLAEGAPVLCLERLRYANGEPWVLARTYLPPDVAPGLLTENLGEQSLYGLLEDKYGVELDHGRRLVEAVPASPAIADALGLRPRDPVLLLRSTAWNTEGRPVEHFIAYHRGDRSRFQVHLRRHTRRPAPVPGMLVHTDEPDPVARGEVTADPPE